jgi:hypothetical protein
MLAAGLPVVAYDAPGPREMLSDIDRSLLTPVGDPYSLASKVLALLDDSDERQRLSARAAATAEKFIWSDIAAQTLLAYAARLPALDARDSIVQGEAIQENKLLRTSVPMDRQRYLPGSSR